MRDEWSLAAFIRQLAPRGAGHGGRSAEPVRLLLAGAQLLPRVPMLRRQLARMEDERALDERQQRCECARLYQSQPGDCLTQADGLRAFDIHGPPRPIAPAARVSMNEKVSSRSVRYSGEPTAITAMAASQRRAGS